MTVFTPTLEGPPTGLAVILVQPLDVGVQSDVGVQPERGGVRPEVGGYLAYKNIGRISPSLTRSK